MSLEWSQRLNRKRVFAAFVGLLIGVGCRGTGMQGGNVQSSFKGISGAEAISPTSVRVTWELRPQFSKYKIYRKDTNSVVGVETFSSYIVRNLHPETVYEFAVAGTDEDGGDEVGLENFISVQTLPSFEGLRLSGVMPKTPTRVDLVWSSASSHVTYDIYARRDDQPWNFSNPVASVKGQDSYSVTNLTGGSKYCFLVVARYLDGTSEPDTSSLTEIDNSAPCVVTETELTGLPLITVNSVIPGLYPWFNAIGGNPSYQIEIYDNVTSSVMATRTGNGPFRAFNSARLGVQDYSAVVKAPSGERAQVPIKIEGKGDSVKVRDFRPTGSLGPIFPDLLANGNGIQKIGTKIVKGDFNCDGLPDIAVSAPYATAYISDQHYHQTGAVVVYYSRDLPPYLDPDKGVVDPPQELHVNAQPSPTAVAPEPQLIYFPVSTNYVRFGTNMAVGNPNGDCYRRDGIEERGGLCDALYSDPVSQIDKIYACDDLAVATADGRVFVIYGDPLSGLVSGSGAANYGINEFTCDPGSGSCRSVRLTSSDSPTTFGTALVFGDYNNDGYDDLAVTGRLSSGHWQVNVLRGSARGLYPVGTANSFPSITSDSLGILPAEEFGNTLGTAFNSRRCSKTDNVYQFRPTAPELGLGYDFEKCDDLIIGVPGRANNRGSIVSCKATLVVAGSDRQLINHWTCTEHYPSELGTDPARYGESILGIPNGNGYPLQQILDGLTPNIGGALFVGAPRAKVEDKENAGKVYAYYITPRAQDRDNGGIAGILGAGGHLVRAQNSIPCNAINSNVQTGTLFHCEHQAIYTSPAQAGAQFGATLGSIEDLNNPHGELRYLVVGAPYRNVLSPDGGSTVSNHGAIYVFRPDTSTFGYDAGIGDVVSSTQYSNEFASPNCTADCTWYSGGVNPFGPSLIYHAGLNADANFGLGGIIGGDFDGDGKGDLIATAPNASDPYAQNGGIYLFKSTGAFASTESQAVLMVKHNISHELNYRFEQAKVVGDVNGDGYEDVMARSISGDGVRLVLFYGSSNGLITYPAPSTSPVGKAPLLIQISSDARIGESFFRIGSVNGDAYDDVLLLSNRGAYVFYGSFSGLVVSEPQVSPVGKGPLKFAIGLTANDVRLDHSDVSAYGQGPGQYDTSMQGVGFGDFNGDGFSDFAIGLNATYTLPPDVDLPPGQNFSATNRGRVIVIYGSANGPQVNRANGRILLSVGGAKADVVAENPCTGGTNPACAVQMLVSPAGNGVRYGFSVLGVTSLEKDSNEHFDELLVGDPYHSSDTGEVYFYRGSSTGLEAEPRQILVPRMNGTRFGYSLAALGDVNRDSYQDVAISAPRGAGYVYVFYSGNVGGSIAFYGASSISATDYWSSGQTPLDVNAPHEDPNAPKPQTLQPAGITNADYFGYGITGLGDFNGDGYADLAVNVAAGDYDVDTTITDTGYVIIYFGGPNGLQANQTVSTTPRCYGGTESVCDPFKAYLPNRQPYEYTWISDSSAGDINGDGVPDLVVGGFGRTHPSGKAFSTGVIYVLY